MVTGARGHQAPLTVGVTEPRFVLLVLHGFGMYDEPYAEAVENIVGSQGRGLIFNLPGHGRWNREHGIPPQLAPGLIGALIAEVVEAAHDFSSPAVVLGESLGCAYAVRAANALAAAGSAPAGMILLAPPLVLRATTVARWVARSVRDVQSTIEGRLQTTPAMLEMVGSAMLAKRFAVDDNIQHSVPLAYVAQSCVDVARMYVDLTKITTPLLVMVGGSDPLIDPASVTAAVSLASSGDKTGTVIETARHGLLWDDQTPVVIAHIRAWLNSVVGNDV